MKNNNSLGLFEMPWVVFCMIPMTITYFLVILVFPNFVGMLGSLFFLPYFIFWIAIFKIFDKITNGYKFYLKWLVKKKLAD